MNVNLAPVLDVFRQPGNFDDQFQRSYSSDPEVCAACGAAFISAQQGMGIAATAKHFPGLGAATRSQNTDLTTVTLTQSADEIRSVDEFPFGAAIGAGVDMVMTSWAVYPALDPEFPAGLSPTIVQGELRDRLGFRGVTITDALEAGAIAPFGDTGARAVLSAQAGMDVLLCSARDVSQGTAAVSAVAAALDDHELNPGHSRQALRRVLDLRTHLG
jgi:beta-N-acetylhexosaminidase